MINKTNFATTASDGKTYHVDYYNLDVNISVGYRVKSLHGTQFSSSEKVFGEKIILEDGLFFFVMATRKMHELAHMHLATANHGETHKACFSYIDG